MTWNRLGHLNHQDRRKANQRAAEHLRVGRVHTQHSETGSQQLTVIMNSYYINVNKFICLKRVGEEEKVNCLYWFIKTTSSLKGTSI